MPRIGRFTLDSIAELCRQLRYAPPETRAKQMDAAETFAAEVEQDQLYPEDFVIFRITGYRPQGMENPALLVGEALVADLAGFVQHLSDGLDLPPDYRNRSAIGLDAVAQRLDVSSKTLQRYRKRGLICHYILFAEGDQRLACFEDALDRFIDTHQKQIERAREFSRVSEIDAQQVISEARSLRKKRAVSLNQAARTLARKHRWAHETIRMLLRRHDRRSAEPIFTERGPLTERDGRLLHRAWRMGVPIAHMAERFGRTSTSIHRAINRRRGEMLRTFPLEHVELPTYQRDDAADVILGVPAVREGLDRLLPQDDAFALLAETKSMKPQRETGIALIAAYNFLKRRARAGIASFNEWPKARELDAVETDLRWASHIKRRLASLGLPVALGRIEQHLHRPLVELPAERIVTAIEVATAIVSDVIETLNPSKRQQLARVVGYAADRALARDGRLVQSAGKASALHSGGTLAMRDPFRNLTPWESALQPRKSLRDRISKERDALTRSLFVQHYGLDGSAPRTIAELAKSAGKSHAAIARRIQSIR